MLKALRYALDRGDNWVLEFEYRDAKGQRTIRTVSPVRMLGRRRFLALCLSREEPRQFYLDRCSNPRLIPAAEVLMPVPIRELAAVENGLEAHPVSVAS